MIGHVIQGRLFAVVVVVGSLMGSSPCTLSQDRGTEESANRSASEQPVVPLRLRSTIRTDFSPFRIPEDKDMVAGWGV